MAGFRSWDVVAVPFPYTDRPVRERRPALVVGIGDIQDKHGLLWVLMITSAANRGWPGDVAVSDLKASGLPAASVVRTAKIATIEAKDAERLGALSPKDRAAIRDHLLSIFAGAFERKG
jgi:mRNA interferase MazF